MLEPRDSDWDPAHIFFEERKLKRADFGGAGDWTGWGEAFELFIRFQLEGICAADRFQLHYSSAAPT